MPIRITVRIFLVKATKVSKYKGEDNIIYLRMNSPTELSSQFAYVFKFKLVKCPEIIIKKSYEIGKTSEFPFSFEVS